MGRRLGRIAVAVGLLSIGLSGPSRSDLRSEPSPVPAEVSVDDRALVREIATGLFHLQRAAQAAEHADELALSADQKRVVDGLNDRTESYTSLLMRQFSGDFKRQLQDELIPAGRETGAALDATLSDAQRERVFYWAISEQRGAIVLLFPGCPEALELTTEQHERIERIIAGNFEILNGTSPSLSDLPSFLWRASQTRARAFAVLTDEQRQRWEALLDGRQNFHQP